MPLLNTSVPQAELAEKNLWTVLNLSRGIAAVGVVLYHLHTQLWVGWKYFWPLPIHFSILQKAGAYIAVCCDPFYSFVMLFFVISGFCIHYPNALEIKPLRISRFYRRRFLRVYPPYLAAIVFTLAIEYCAYRNINTIFVRKDLILDNIFMLRGGFGLLNGSLWSLPVEMELYLIYPLLYFIVRRTGWLNAIMIVSAVSAAAGYFSWHGASWVRFHFPIYWIIWLSGMGLANLWRTNKLRPLSIFWLILAGFSGALAHCMRTSQPDVMWLPWGLCYFIITWFAITQTRFLKIDLGSLHYLRLPLFIGAMSYSLYLTHAPLLDITRWFLRTYYNQAVPINFFLSLVMIIPCILVASIFYLMIEKPSHHAARQLI